MAATPTYNYPRNTTFSITHTYQKTDPTTGKMVNSSAGQILFFTVKSTQFDAVSDDSSAVIQKTVGMSGPTTVVTINPNDVADTVAPGEYFFDFKIKESDGPPKVIYQGIAGIFNIIGYPTNRE